MKKFTIYEPPASYLHIAPAKQGRRNKAGRAGLQSTIFKNRIKYSTFYIVLCTFFFASCDPNRVFEDNVEIPDYSWDEKNKISFDVNIPDTISPYNLYVNIRHASHYPYANLYLFISIKFPNGKMAKDTLECIFADASGRWKGEGMGDIWDNQILWKPDIKFPLAGKYMFEYEQAMRTPQVPFIMDVGLRVEKAEKKNK